MSVPKDMIRENLGIGEWNIIHGYRGSIAHGMYIPNTDPFSVDDKDTMGICVPPKEYYIGLKEFGSKGTKEIKRNEWDIVIYEVKKAIKLLEIGNPNILGLL
jgi:predicted nucleotidyltransferase